MIVSVVIPFLRPDARLERLLLSLSKQKGAREILEVLCVNNLKSYQNYDLETRWRESFLDFKYLTTGVKSANIARNLGIRFSTGELLFFIDSDCQINDPDFIARLVELHQIHADVCGIGGPYSLPMTANKLSQRYFAIADMWLRASLYTPEGYTTALLGGNCSYKRSVFERGLNFDLGRSYGGTEVSLNHRLHLIGEKILFVDSLKVEHHLELSLKEFLYKAFKQGQGKAYNKLQNNIDQSHLLKEQIFAANDFYSKLYDSFFHLGYNLRIEKGSFSNYTIAILDFLFLESLRRRLWWLKIPFHAIKPYFWWLKMPFYYVTRFLWWFKIPYYIAIKYLWYLKMPYHFVRQHIWGFIVGTMIPKLGLAYVKTRHFIKHLAWQIFHLVKAPIIKIYYMAKYHIETYILPLVRKKD